MTIIYDAKELEKLEGVEDIFQKLSDACAKARDEMDEKLEQACYQFCIDTATAPSECVILEHTPMTCELNEATGKYEIRYKYKLVTRKEYEEMIGETWEH
jgi:hypothetical protein